MQHHYAWREKTSSSFSAMVSIQHHVCPLSRQKFVRRCCRSVQIRVFTTDSTLSGLWRHMALEKHELVFLIVTKNQNKGRKKNLQPVTGLLGSKGHSGSVLVTIETRHNAISDHSRSWKHCCWWLTDFQSKRSFRKWSIQNARQRKIRKRSVTPARSRLFWWKVTPQANRICKYISIFASFPKLEFLAHLVPIKMWNNALYVYLH